MPRSVYKHIKYSFNYTGNHRTLQNCFYDGKIYSNDYSGIYDKNAPDGALSNEAFPTGLDIISYYNYSTICGCAWISRISWTLQKELNDSALDAAGG